MSVPDLIFAIFWFVAGVLTLRWRRNLTRFRRITLAAAALYLLLGLLWLDLAL